MVTIPLTESNRNFASTVNKRINADSVMLSAKASVWRLGGIGLLLMLAGVGLGCGLFGYSYVNDDQALADRMAASFAKVLEHVRVPVTGEVEVKPGGTVDVKPGGTVDVKPGGTVEVKPGGTVEMKPGGNTGTGTAINDVRPTPQQLNGSSPPASQAKVVTNFTIFKNVPFGAGIVTTGWMYSSNEQSIPEDQYCYYKPDPNAENGQTIYLATKGGGLTSIGSREDYKAVLAACSWFNGQQPYAMRPYATQPYAMNGPKTEFQPPSTEQLKTAWVYQSDACGEKIGYTIHWTELPPTDKAFLGPWSGIWNSKNKTCGAVIVTQIFGDRGVKADYYYKVGNKLKWKSLSGLFHSDNTISMKDDEDSTFEFTRVGDTLTAQFSGRSGQTHATFNRVQLKRG